MKGVEHMRHITTHRRSRLASRIALQTAAAGKPSDLDITELRLASVREPVGGNRYSLLRITTRSGLIGWGECAYEPNADVKALQSRWLGKPANVYAMITSSIPCRAALDIALLDILGKAANAPIYRILGGPTRNKVRAYSSPFSQAFPVAVIDVPVPTSRNQGKAYQNRILELVGALPADRDFVLEGSGLLTPGDAASVAKTVELKHPLWFDEPCSHSNVEAVRKISGETVVPLGFGHGIDDPGVFQSLLREGLIDVVRPDIAIFGITGVRRIAALAEPYRSRSLIMSRLLLGTTGDPLQPPRLFISRPASRISSSNTFRCRRRSRIGRCGMRSFRLPLKAVTGASSR